MLDFFSGIRIYVKLDKVNIDNHVFKLHYKATVIILLAASFLVVRNQYIGDPIDCMVGDVSAEIMDQYCWIHSTFSIPERWIGKQGVDNAHPGVAPAQPDGKDPRYHKYYQWVCFVLVIQAALFYAPRFIWKNAEQGVLKSLVEDMNTPEYVVDRTKKEDRIDYIIKYMKDFRGHHVQYSLRFFLCEVLNFINIVSQIFLMDRFLGGEFSEYGLRVLEYTETDARDRPDPMAVVFPKVTKCTFHKYGASGSIETHDALCVLPLNIINEKIYVFLWFWFIIVTSITGLHILYRAFILLGPGLRVSLIQAKVGRDLPREKIEDLLQDKSLNIFQQIGEFFLLYQMLKNMDEVTNKEIVLSIHRTFFKPLPLELNGNSLSATSV